MKGADKAKFIEHELDYNSMDSKEFEKLKDELMDVLCQANRLGLEAKTGNSG